MKNFILIIFILFQLTDSETFSQSDSILKVTDCTFSYLIITNQKDSLNNVVKTVSRISKIEDVSQIIFINDDSIQLINSYGKSVFLNVKYSNEVSIKNGNYLLLGMGIGLVSGALIGVAIGSKADFVCWDCEFSQINPTVFGGIIGGLAGGLIGVLIGSIIDQKDNLELNKVEVKQRKSAIIKFINNSNK